MNQLPQLPNPEQYTVLRILRGRELLRIVDIVRLEGDLNYTRFVLVDGRMLLTSKNLSFYEPLLPNTFIRVHKSSLLNRDYITDVGKYYVKMTDGYKAAVARRKRKMMKKLVLLPKISNQHPH